MAASLGLAPPHAHFSPPVRELLDELVADADTPLQPLLARGREQLEAFLQHAHGGVDSFDALVAREAPAWREHLLVAERDADVRVQTRALPAEALRVPFASAKDVKVGRPGRPDDAVYLKSEYARRFLPRGNFLAEYASEALPPASEPYVFPLLRGYRKFSGQEDDGELQAAAATEGRDGAGDRGARLLSAFFTKPAALARWVVSTSKENGEAGHLAVLKRRDGAFVFALGSKNTHLLAATLADVDAWYAGDAFQAARPMAKAVLSAVLALPPADRSLLCEFLWQTRATACFEVLCPAHQHVQLLAGLDEDTPVFFGLTLPLLEPLAGAEVCVSPLLPLALMRRLGLRTVAFAVVDSAREDSRRAAAMAHAQHQHEGVVNLFLDADANVIGLEKRKTAWYVCLRAIREKAKAFCAGMDPKKRQTRASAPSKRGGGPREQRLLTPEQVLDASRAQLRRRFAAIQPYLQLSDAATSAYRGLGERFLEFLLSVKLSGGHGDACGVQREVADLFPVVWSHFLEHTHLSDDIAVS